MKRIIKKTIWCVIIVYILFFVPETTRNTFYVAFFPSSFYKPIYEERIDLWTQNNTVRIPLDYWYETEYSFNIVGPSPTNICKIGSILDGVITYRILHDSAPVESGCMIMDKAHAVSIKNKRCTIKLFYFHLPYSDITDDLELEITIAKPFDMLKQYEDEIRCSVRPSFVK